MRDTYVSLDRYKFKFTNKMQEQILIALIDGNNYHGGFTDRFKGIITLFNYCLANEIIFRISYTFPFKLEDYLVTNEYDWILRNCEYCENLISVKYLNLVGESSAKRLLLLNTKKQIHCHANRDVLGEINSYYHLNNSWGTLFNRLFMPNDRLREQIEGHIKNIGKKYISAVFRFQQLLGDFREYDFHELPDNRKEELISKNIKALHRLMDQYPDHSMLVTSDSLTFLKRIMNISGTYPLLGKVVHIDCTTDADYDVYMKSFLDFYMLSKGEMIYSIGTSDMYKTEFPLYAAKINNIPFFRINID